MLLSRSDLKLTLQVGKIVAPFPPQITGGILKVFRYLPLSQPKHVELTFFYKYKGLPLFTISIIPSLRTGTS
jgi:hypothetical protein